MWKTAFTRLENSRGLSYSKRKRERYGIIRITNRATLKLLGTNQFTSFLCAELTERDWWQREHAIPVTPNMLLPTPPLPAVIQYTALLGRMLKVQAS
jgi:hypothetical protein